MDLVSIVIPCFNPDDFLLDTIASARAQRDVKVEIIVVNDGSTDPDSERILARAAGQADLFIEQTNRGVSAARNAGMRAASGNFLLPLDSQDLLKSQFASTGVAALHAQPPEIAFAFADYRVFGERNYAERLPDYNLWDLMENNTIPYAALYRAAAWREAGGYDESFAAHEDWEFFLALAGRGYFGHHVNRVLWAYRRQSGGLSDVGRRHHSLLEERIRAKHRALYSPESIRRIKAYWRPAVCVAGAEAAEESSIFDCVASLHRRPEGLLAASRADVFLFPGGETCAEQVELAALAALDARSIARFPNGAVAVPREQMRRAGSAALAPKKFRRALTTPGAPGFFQTLWRHLDNAEMLSAEAWRSHPGQVLARLIPLRWKERINRAAGRRVFDLSFYLRFQPQSLVLGDSLVRLAKYLPKIDGSRRRIALVTPHLGPGGAESVLLDAARAIDRSRFEILLIATQSADSRWAGRWRAAADHVYDLREAVPSRCTAAAVLSIISNWGCSAMLVQNSLAGYQAIADLKNLHPELRILDLVHAVGETWDVVRCTAAMAGLIDVRVAVSAQAERHLRRAGVPAERIRRIGNGVDLERFACRPEPEGARRILFAARLDPVKRPRLVVEIARAMAAVENVRFVIAGDGPEEGEMRAAARRAGVEQRFEFLGFAEDMAPLFEAAAVVLITSSEEGVPLVLLEAFASGRPVVASSAGAIGEMIGEDTGVLIARGRHEAQEFAAALRALLGDPGRRERMGRAARRKVEEEHSKAVMLEAYRELLESPVETAVLNAAK